MTIIAGILVEEIPPQQTARSRAICVVLHFTNPTAACDCLFVLSQCIYLCMRVCMLLCVCMCVCVCVCVCVRDSWQGRWVLVACPEGQFVRVGTTEEQWGTKVNCTLNEKSWMVHRWEIQADYTEPCSKKHMHKHTHIHTHTYSRTCAASPELTPIIDTLLTYLNHLACVSNLTRCGFGRARLSSHTNQKKQPLSTEVYLSASV